MSDEVKAHDEAVSGMVGQLEVCACGHNRCMHRGVQGHAQCTQKSCRCYLFRNPAPDPLSCGASDGEMGDENWVYEYTCDHLAVSVPSKHDPLWSVAWSNGERIGEGASQPLMWADARHRLTPEAAAEPVDGLAGVIQAMRNAGQNDMADFCESLGSDEDYGYVPDSSPAPALKTQEGEDTALLLGILQNEAFLKMKSDRDDLASLAKKLAAALEKRHRRDRIASRRNHEYMLSSDSCYKEECAVLAEAKKAGCA